MCIRDRAEVDVALDADGCRAVIGTLQRDEEVQHERQGDLVGEQHTHAEQRQTEQQHQPEEEALAPFQDVYKRQPVRCCGLSPKKTASGIRNNCNNKTRNR